MTVAFELRTSYQTTLHRLRPTFLDFDPKLMPVVYVACLGYSRSRTSTALQFESSWHFWQGIGKHRTEDTSSV